MEKQIKIALAGNPNCGKTTLFNALRARTSLLVTGPVLPWRRRKAS